MTPETIHRGVKLKIDKSDSLNYTSFLPEEIDFWLNQGMAEWLKTRVTGNNVKRESIEQTQKRIDDLRSLIKEQSILTTTGSSKPNSYLALLPTDYLYAIGEEVNINYIRKNYSLIRVPGANSLTSGTAYLVGSVTVTTGAAPEDVRLPNTVFVSSGTLLTGGNVTSLYTLRTGITETTSDRYSSDIDNPFGNFVLQYGKAKPLRLFTGNNVELITDGNYYVTNYFLRYVKVPIDYSYNTKTVLSGEIQPGVVYRVTANAPLNYMESPSVVYAGTTYIGSNVTFTGIEGYTSFTKTTKTTVKQYSVADVSDYVHQEIINIAVNMMIENVGDTERFQTNSVQINKME